MLTSISCISLKAKNKGPEPVDYSAKVTHRNCLILSRNANATRMTKRSRIRLKVNSNKVVFMRQIDQSLEERNAARKERVMVANRFRRCERFPQINLCRLLSKFQ